VPTGVEIPSPESRIDTGELLPEWVTLRVADFGPVLAGVKLTWIVVDCPGAKVTSVASLKSSENWPGLVPVKSVAWTTMSGSPVPPKLVSCTVFVPVPFTTTWPKSELDGAPSSFGRDAERISIALIFGFSTTWPKSISRFESAATVNVFTTPLYPPTSAKMS
jgi:hypothetical protein